MDEIARRKANFARLIEDGRKIEVFTSMPEYKWYVESVIQPTIANETDKVMHGDYKTSKEDWIARGIVLGLQMVVDATATLIEEGKRAKKSAKDYQRYLDAEG